MRNEEIENLGKKIASLENKVEKFKELRKTLINLSASGAKVTLDAPLDDDSTFIRIEEREKPSADMIYLLDLQDSANKIEYDPEGNRYILKIKMWE